MEVEMHHRAFYYDEAYEAYRCMTNAEQAAASEIGQPFGGTLERAMHFEGVTRSAIATEEGRAWYGVLEAASWLSPEDAVVPQAANADNEEPSLEHQATKPSLEQQAATNQDAPHPAPGPNKRVLEEVLPGEDATALVTTNTAETGAAASGPADADATLASNVTSRQDVAAAKGPEDPPEDPPAPPNPIEHPTPAVAPVPSWMELAFEMVDQMERMVRCMTQQDESDAVTALQRGFHSMVALQRLHDGVVGVVEGEVQHRYLVAAAEDFGRREVEDIRKDGLEAILQASVQNLPEIVAEGPADNDRGRRPCPTNCAAFNRQRVLTTLRCSSIHCNQRYWTVTRTARPKT